MVYSMIRRAIINIMVNLLSCVCEKDSFIKHGGAVVPLCISYPRVHEPADMTIF